MFATRKKTDTNTARQGEETAGRRIQQLIDNIQQAYTIYEPSISLSIIEENSRQIEKILKQNQQKLYCHKDKTTILIENNAF